MSKSRWEHKVILGHGISDAEAISWTNELNRHGAEGWELVSVVVRPEVPTEEATSTVAHHSAKRRFVVFMKREARA